jgi:hypothetical protein
MTTVAATPPSPFAVKTRRAQTGYTRVQLLRARLYTQRPARARGAIGSGRRSRWIGAAAGDRCECDFDVRETVTELVRYTDDERRGQLRADLRALAVAGLDRDGCSNACMRIGRKYDIAQACCAGAKLLHAGLGSERPACLGAAVRRGHCGSRGRTAGDRRERHRDTLNAVTKTIQYLYDERLRQLGADDSILVIARNLVELSCTAIYDDLRDTADGARCCRNGGGAVVDGGYQSILVHGCNVRIRARPNQCRRRQNSAARIGDDRVDLHGRAARIECAARGCERDVCGALRNRDRGSADNDGRCADRRIDGRGPVTHRAESPIPQALDDARRLDSPFDLPVDRLARRIHQRRRQRSLGTDVIQRDFRRRERDGNGCTGTELSIGRRQLRRMVRARRRDHEH